MYFKDIFIFLKIKQTSIEHSIIDNYRHSWYFQIKLFPKLLKISEVDKNVHKKLPNIETNSFHTSTF